MKVRQRNIDLRAADVLNGREVQLVTGRPHNEVMPNDRMLGVEAGPFYKASESYEIKNSQESF